LNLFGNLLPTKLWMPLSESFPQDQRMKQRPNGSSKVPLCAPNNNNNNNNNTPFLPNNTDHPSHSSCRDNFPKNYHSKKDKQTAAATMEDNQKKADASVKKSKAFFLIGLTVSAIVTAIGSGYLVAQSETKTFEEKV
jgi:hypothetical protein